MKLYFIHCGFYDEEISEGIYEFHVNLPVVAENFDEAKKKVRTEPLFIRKKMHIDGIQEIEVAQGFRVRLVADEKHEGKSLVTPECHRDL